jgi:hypothetical protein
LTRRVWLAALFILAATESVAAWDVHGHAKLQSSLLLFRDDDLAAQVTGERAADQTLDLRLNTVYRTARWDLTLNSELLGLTGDSVRARHDPSLGGLGGLLLGLPDPSDAQQWFDLSRSFTDRDSRLLFGRLDRCSVGYTGDRLVLRLGRQALSWGDGLVFQVLDLFNPFAPTAVDTEYKPGSDMLSSQWLLAGGDDVQAIVVPRRPARGAALASADSSLAVKWHHFAGATQLDLLAARHYDDTVAGVGVSGNLGGGVWRLDVAYTSLRSGGSATSLVANSDHSWVWAGRNAYGFLEYFRNGFGVSSVDRGVAGLPAPLVQRLTRGELFSLGRNELAAGLRYEWTPRFTVDPTLIFNLDDHSALWLLHCRFDWLQNFQLDAGAQAGQGPRGTEYGGVPLDEAGLFVAPGRRIWVRVSRYF